MAYDIFSLFEAEKKKDVEKVCSEITIKHEDLRHLINLSNAKIIEFPYLHACKYIEVIPDNVQLTEKNINAITTNGAGKLNPEAQKAIRKIFQMPLMVKRTTAHLFYRHDYRFWHLFYFDLKDRWVLNNHWGSGTHLHYVSWLWPNLSCKEVWSSVCEKGKKGIGASEHIRFEK